jgi:hypothetical protein
LTRAVHKHPNPEHKAQEENRQQENAADIGKEDGQRWGDHTPLFVCSIASIAVFTNIFDIGLSPAMAASPELANS